MHYLRPLYPGLLGWALMLHTSSFSHLSLVNGTGQLVLFLFVVCLPIWRTGRMSYVDIGWPFGLVLLGIISFFLIERPFEQIKLDIDHQNVNVNLVGYADYPTLGPTHTELDGKKTMELFKNIKSFFPSDGYETEKMAIKANQIKGPTFISLKIDPNPN